MFSVFKKKEVKREFITSNPPAREIALQNRKKIIEREIEIIEYNILDKINSSIEIGRFDCQFDYDYIRCDKYKYDIREICMYLASRKLRKSGFKVKLRTYKFFVSGYKSKIQISW